MSDRAAEYRELDVTGAVIARLRMDDSAKAIQERDAKHHTGGSRFVNRVERLTQSNRALLPTSALLERA